MANHVLLNNVDHRDWRVLTRPSAAFGDDVASVLTVPTEFADIQRHYPILFRKRPDTGRFYAIALLGLDQGRNLFLSDDGWSVPYVPGFIARGPFLIGFQDRPEDGAVRRAPVIHLDADSPRLSRTEGEPIFREHGGSSRYLERIVAILDGLQTGIAASEAMFDAFTSLALIEPVSIQIDPGAGEAIDLTNLYAINEDRFAALSGEALAALNAAGFLQAAVLAIASLGNIPALIARRNAARA